MFLTVLNFALHTLGRLGSRLTMSYVVTPGRDEMMKDDPVVLDEHRGMAAQKATEIRRHLAAIEADQAALRQRQEELEKFLLATPSATWEDAADKARYLISLFAVTSEGQDPRRQKIIAGVLNDFRRLSGGPTEPVAASEPNANGE